MTTARTVGKVVFIAIPTKGVTNSSSAGEGRLLEQVHKDLARLHERYPDHTFLVPMVQDYALLPHLGVAPTWEVWGDRCRRLIERADEVWVLMYNGWVNPTLVMDAVYNTSKGVFGELVHAVVHSVPVFFMDPRRLR